jgi:hypothetical protein
VWERNVDPVYHRYALALLVSGDLAHEVKIPSL